MIDVLRPFAVLAILVAWQPAAARTWHIRADGSGEAPTIQAGHDSAAAGDSVLASWGSYHEHITIDRMIYLVSEVGPLYTVVDGGGAGRVLTILSSATPGPFVSGFTLQNGYDSLEGGGVWVRASGTVIRECHIINNSVGTFDSGLGGGVSMAEVSGCVIEECLIRGNYAGSGGGGIAVGGNNMIRRNVIRENSTHVGGGGVAAGSAVIVENVIVRNASDHFAGGVYISFGELRNNTIAYNITGDLDAGAGIVTADHAVVRNNIVVKNESGSFGRAIGCGGTGVTIQCNDIWGNTSDVIECWSGSTVADNISADPLFCEEEDYTISIHSPCFAAVPCDLIGARVPACTIATIQPHSWSAVKDLYR